MISEKLRKQLSDLGPWAYDMRITDDFSTKNITKGIESPEKLWSIIKTLLPKDLSGMKILDVGCNAGFYSFKLRRRNAKILGIDYKPFIDQAKFLSKLFKIKADFRVLSVYDLNSKFGKFDAALFLGVFYHLKFPFLAIKKISEVTDFLIMETEVLKNSKDTNKMQFIEHTYHNDGTNWWIPGEECVRAMLRAYGFKYIMTHRIYEDKNYSRGKTVEGMKKQNRAIFCASKKLGKLSNKIFPERIYAGYKEEVKL